MSDMGETFGSAGLSAGQRLRAEAAEVFTEVQRADGKGTTLCGVTGGLLTVDAAVLSSAPKGSWLPVAALACTAALLGVTLIAAVSAIRPVLPRSGGFKVLACPTAGSARPEEALSVITVMTVDEHLRTEAERWRCSSSWRRGSSGLSGGPLTSRQPPS